MPTEILTKTLYPIAAAQYDFTTGVGVPTWVDADFGIWIQKEGPVQLQWVYDLNALHSERAGRRMVITGMSLSFGASVALSEDVGKTATYVLYVQNYGYTGISPGHNRDYDANIGIVPNTVNQSYSNITLYKGDMSDFGGGEETMAVLSGIINKYADADEWKQVCVSCELFNSSEINAARARYGVITLHYYYDDAPTRAINNVNQPSTMAFGERAQGSGVLMNAYNIDLFNPTKNILKKPVIRFVRQGSTPIDDVDVMDPYRVPQDIYPYGKVSITDRNYLLALYQWSEAPRATQIKVRVDIEGRNVEYSDFMTALDKKYNPSIIRFSTVRAENRSGELVESDTSIFTMTSVKIAISEGNFRNGFTLRAYYAQSSQEFDPDNYVPINISGTLINQYITGVTNVPNLVDPKNGTEIIGYTQNSDWIIRLVFTDGYESNDSFVYLYKAVANFHMSGFPNGGVCAGGFCSTAGRSHDPAEDGPGLNETYYQFVPYAGIRGCDYSVGETKTPFKWIDGKPVYRRVFTVTNPTLVNNAYSFETISDCDTVISLNGLWRSSWSGTNRNWFMFPYSELGNSSVIAMLTVENGVPRYSQNFDLRPSEIIIIIEYTKTTD